mgnify:CR=1 FL=1
MTTELTKYDPEAALLALAEQQAAMGYEDLPVSQRTPYLRVPQANSKRPARDFAGQIVLKEGDSFESWANEGQDVQVIPLYTIRRIVASFPFNDAPAGENGAKLYTADSTWDVGNTDHPLVACVADNRDPKKRIIQIEHGGKVYPCKVQEELVVVLLFMERFIKGEPCIGFLGHRGLSYGPCIDMIARCRSHAKSVAVPGSDPPITKRVPVPMYWSVFSLKTVSQPTTHGDFFRVNYKFIGMPTDTAHLAAIQSLASEVAAAAEEMRARFVQLDEEAAAEEGSEGAAPPSESDIA